jgi:hypothetical protein
MVPIKDCASGPGRDAIFECGTAENDTRADIDMTGGSRSILTLNRYARSHPSKIQIMSLGDFPEVAHAVEIDARDAEQNKIP